MYDLQNPKKNYQPFCLFQNVDDIDWDKFWDPKIHVDNILGESKQNLWRTILIDESGRVTVHEKRRIKAVFMERMELNQFPFDTQVQCGLYSAVAAGTLSSFFALFDDNLLIACLNYRAKNIA